MSSFDLIPDPLVRSALEAGAAVSMMHAVEMQGIRALAMPRKLAVCHEVGHAILFASEQVPVSCVEIFRVDVTAGWDRQPSATEQSNLKDLGPTWGGFCWAKGGPFNWDCHKQEDLLKCSLAHISHGIRMQISGLAGETALYRGDVPGASSIDERAVSQFAAIAAGQISNQDPQKLWLSLFRECVGIIKQNEIVARRLIRALGHPVDKVEGDALEAILRKVKRRRREPLIPESGSATRPSV
jgi:hypothetical protein